MPRPRFPDALTYDVLIAGQARARNLTLVTNKTDEFARVPGLQLQDWTL